MKKQNYSEQIKSPKWQKKRLEILNLRGFKCEECGNEEQQLHIHHRVYIKNRQAWEYDNDIFQVLCSDCHEKVHQKKKIEIPLSDEETWLINLLRRATIIDEHSFMYLNNILDEYLRNYPESEFLQNLFMSTINGDFDKILSDVTYIGERFRIETDLSNRLEAIESELEQFKNKTNG